MNFAEIRRALEEVRLIALIMSIMGVSVGGAIGGAITGNWWLAAVSAVIFVLAGVATCDIEGLHS